MSAIAPHLAFFHSMDVQAKVMSKFSREISVNTGEKNVNTRLSKHKCAFFVQMSTKSQSERKSKQKLLSAEKMLIEDPGMNYCSGNVQHVFSLRQRLPSIPNTHIFFFEYFFVDQHVVCPFSLVVFIFAIFCIVLDPEEFLNIDGGPNRPQ